MQFSKPNLIGSSLKLFVIFLTFIVQKKSTKLLFYNKFSIFLNKKTPHPNPLPASGEMVRVRGKDILYERKYFLF